ncbi:glycine-rich domain-containing protein, partial [Kaistella carnis]|uniref:glycine-rich domain-containing protein n=1 Tax=Kaistella carnis TaxID=1241979 RepID=UPI0035E41BA7
MTSITVQSWGAGGAGGGSTDAGFLSARGGAGGGGGAYATATIAVVPGASLPIVVGTGGTGAVAMNGTAGTHSTITGYETTIYAEGGKGGNANINGNPSGGAGGSVAGSKGSPIAGSTGGNGDTGIFISSGAGGDAANSIGSGGGAVGSGSSVGNTGSQPGGGGGGSRSSSLDNGKFAGGKGGNGRVIITYKSAYLAQFISADTGSTTWCPGETRTVTVTIKNIGTQPWIDGGGKDFNIGVKWNTNGTSWNDYHVRVDAGNLAPGSTKTYFLPITASNNVLGTGYTTPLAVGSNNLTFDVVYDGVSWFGNNNGVVGPGNTA